MLASGSRSRRPSHGEEPGFRVGFGWRSRRRWRCNQWPGGPLITSRYKLGPRAKPRGPFLGKPAAEEDELDSDDDDLPVEIGHG